jgi:hypothetical protein
MFSGVGSKPGRRRVTSSDASFSNLAPIALARAGVIDTAFPVMPCGRLTTTSGTPILTSTTSAQTTVYYTPYRGRYCPIWNGTSFVIVDLGGELSQATTDATKSPAACTTNSNYDKFVWWDISTGQYRCTRGPAWSSSTSRGTGSGTTELELVGGIYVNKVDITNGPKARRGTYVGSIRTNGSSQVDWIYGAAASGGTAGVFGIWNAYHRNQFGTMVNDTTNSWDTAPSGAQAANGSSTFRVSCIFGLQTECVFATYTALSNGLGAAIPLCGVAVDSTNTLAGTSGYGLLSALSSFMGTYTGSGLGFHFYQAIKNASSAATIRFYGQAGDATRYNAGLVVNFWA